MNKTKFTKEQIELINKWFEDSHFFLGKSEYLGKTDDHFWIISADEANKLNNIDGKRGYNEKDKILLNSIRSRWITYLTKPDLVKAYK